MAALATAAEILSLAQAAMSVATSLQQRSLEIQQRHASGQTESDDELQKHLDESRAKVAALKAL